MTVVTTYIRVAPDDAISTVTPLAVFGCLARVKIPAPPISASYPFRRR